MSPSRVDRRPAFTPANGFYRAPAERPAPVCLQPGEPESHPF